MKGKVNISNLIAIAVLLVSISVTLWLGVFKFAELMHEVRDIGSDIDKLENKMDRQFEKIDMQFEKIDQRFEMLEYRFDNLENEFHKMDLRVNGLGKRNP